MKRLKRNALGIAAVAVVALLVPLRRFPRARGDLTGRWTGRMEPKNLSAEIELDLQRTGTSWNGVMTFRAGPDGGALPVEELRVEGDTLFVRTKIEGADVSLQLALDDGLLLGSVRATEGGRVLAEGPAGLARASETTAQERLTRWLDAQSSPIDAARRGAVIERAVELMLTNYGFADGASELRRTCAHARSAATTTRSPAPPGSRSCWADISPTPPRIATCR